MAVETVYAGPGGIYGPWQTSEFFVLSANDSAQVSMDFESIHDNVGLFTVQVQYWDGQDIVTEEYPITGEGNVTVTVESGADDSASTVHFRIKSQLGAQIVRVESNVDFLPGHPGVPMEEPTQPPPAAPFANLEELRDKVNDLLEDSLGTFDGQRKEEGKFMRDVREALQEAMNSTAVPRGDPLILDLNNDGISLISITSSQAYFNLEDRDFATINGWVTGGDGLLCFDANGNGIIDGIDELFGSPTETGFEQLEAWDTNTSGTITSADADWSDLLVWIDDGDGYAQPDELHTLDDLDITQIGLTTTASGTFINGNELVETATFVMDGNNRTIGEVLFQIDPTNSLYVGTDLTAIKADALWLPHLKGHGVVASTLLAYSMDEDLFGMAEDLVLIGALGDFDDFRADLRDFLFKWSGVDTVDPDSRGASTFGGDAQELAFVEKYTGINFQTPTDDQDPGSWYQWHRVQDVFAMAIEGLALRFLVQTDETLQSVLGYDFASDTLVLKTADSGDLADATTGLSASEEALYWAVLAKAEYENDADGIALRDFVLENLRAAESDLTSGQLAFFNIGIGEWVGPITGPWEGIVSDPANYRPALLLGGDAGDDIKNPYNNLIDYGDMVFRGGEGNDGATGVEGTNLFIGNEGNDDFHGANASENTYFFRLGDGDDTIDAAETGTDRIILADDIEVADVAYSRSNMYDLLISIDGGDSIKVDGFFNSYDYGVTFQSWLDEIVFADATVHDTEDFFAAATTWSGTSGNDVQLIGSSESETIDGLAGNDVVYANDGHDTVYGSSGNDTVYAGEGQDVVYGGADADLLYGVEGDDTLIGGTGNDQLSGSIGNDVYMFSDGDGQDSIWEYSTYDDVSNGTDKIVFDASVSKASVHYQRSSNNLVITYGTGSDQITVGGFFNTGAFWVPYVDLYEIESVEFSDASTHDLAYIYSEALTQTGTSGAETIHGLASAYRDYNDTIYGLGGNDWLYGYNGNDYLDGGTGVDVLIGGEDDDTYVVDDVSEAPVENASAGTDTVLASVSYTLGSHLENLTLTGSSNLNGTGNSLDNVLAGNTGNNTLTGAGGNDTYVFADGDGADVIVDSAGTDAIEFDASVSSASAAYSRSGDDLIITYGTGSDQVTVFDFFNGTTNRIEEVRFYDTTVHDVSYILAQVNTGTSGPDTLTGTSGDDPISGLGGNDTLYGLAGNDTLDGGTGDDAMFGGEGDDLYIVDSASDTVTENASEGTDTVQSGVTWTLGANVENLTLTGSSNINGVGNSLDNVITGNSGVNTLTGGAGDDVYYVDSYSDVPVETSGQGTDTVYTSSDFWIYTSHIEVVIATGTANVELWGNGIGTNTLIGNSGDNILMGRVGTDVLDGGDGVDTASYAAAASAVVVNLATGTASGGDGSDTLSNIENITGSAYNDTLTGNSGNNVLDGGAGNDSMTGGAGNDTYYVDSASDMVSENAAEGTDTVYSSVTFTISDADVENLTLTGSSNINGTGNSSANILIGNSGVNTLTGGDGNDTLDGGVGDDTMAGGAGDDVYYVDSYTDVILETSGQGTDIVYTSSDFWIYTSHIEVVIATGTANVELWGNGIGTNTLIGNSGDNILMGRVGTDVLDGGDGVDTASYAAAASAVVVNLATGTASGGDGSDTLSNIENITGSAYNDTLTGDGGNNVLTGLVGTDTLTGGSGDDTFVFDMATAFSNIDVITDFNISTQEDVLDLRDLLEEYDPLSDSLSDFLQIADSGGNSTVSVDRDGTGGTYSMTQIATLNSITGLTDEDALVASGNLLVA